MPAASNDASVIRLLIALPKSMLTWPLAGQDGRDWVINNYADLDATIGTRAARVLLTWSSSVIPMV